MEKGSLTQEQIKELGNKLYDTTQNVYRVAERVFGVEVGDEIFDQLQEHAELQKCEECNFWKGCGQMEPDFISTCCECAAEMN
jgi:hypothetical protein